MCTPTCAGFRFQHCKRGKRWHLSHNGISLLTHNKTNLNVQTHSWIWCSQFVWHSEDFWELKIKCFTTMPKGFLRWHESYLMTSSVRWRCPLYDMEWAESPTGDVDWQRTHPPLYIRAICTVQECYKSPPPPIPLHHISVKEMKSFCFSVKSSDLKMHLIQRIAVVKCGGSWT